MPPNMDELLAHMQALEDQLEAEYNARRDAFARRRAELAERFLELQQRQKVGLWSYLRHSRWTVILSAPVIYAGWPVFALLDAFISAYQAVCFPVYRIRPVRRAD